MSEPAPPVATNPETAFEPSDWRIGPIALGLLGVVVAVALAILVLHASFTIAASDAVRPLTVQMPAPRLQVDPAADLAALRAREDRDLNTYYWIDRDKGAVHIPIGEAMKEIATHGLDGFSPAAK